MRARRGPWLFFGAAFAITWVLQGPAALASAGVLAVAPEGLMPAVGFGLFGPLVAAILALRLEPDGEQP